MLGAVGYLVNRSDIEHIGVMGTSTGGNAAIIAATDEPRLEAVIAMGGFSSLADDVLELQTNLSWNELVIRKLVLFLSDTNSGFGRKRSVRWTGLLISHQGRLC